MKIIASSELAHSCDIVTLYCKKGINKKTNNEDNLDPRVTVIMIVIIILKTTVISVICHGHTNI